MKSIKEILPRAVVFILIFTIICGLAYTGVVTMASQIIFPKQANGSIIEVNGKKYGCELLGQQYKDEKHMWGRIMNIDVSTYKDKNGKVLMYSSPANISPASKEYEKLIEQRISIIRTSHPEKGDTAIPVDLVTCSGSGLDPHISIAAAEYQVQRLAKNNNISEERVKSIIDQCTDNKLFGVLGEKTVNVLRVNLMIDGILK